MSRLSSTLSRPPKKMVWEEAKARPLSSDSCVGGLWSPHERAREFRWDDLLRACIVAESTLSERSASPVSMKGGDKQSSISSSSREDHETSFQHKIMIHVRVSGARRRHKSLAERDEIHHDHVAGSRAAGLGVRRALHALSKDRCRIRSPRVWAVDEGEASYSADRLAVASSERSVEPT